MESLLGAVVVVMLIVVAGMFLVYIVQLKKNKPVTMQELIDILNTPNETILATHDMVKDFLAQSPNNGHKDAQLERIKEAIPPMLLTKEISFLEAVEELQPKAIPPQISPEEKKKVHYDAILEGKRKAAEKRAKEANVT